MKQGSYRQVCQNKYMLYSIEKENTCFPSTKSCACQLQLCLKNTNSFTVVTLLNTKVYIYKSSIQAVPTNLIWMKKKFQHILLLNIWSRKQYQKMFENKKILQRRPPRPRLASGQLAIWSERLTPNLVDVSLNPLCGHDMIVQKTYGVQYSFQIPLCLYSDVGGCFDRTKDCCDYGIGNQTL